MGGRRFVCMLPVVILCARLFAVQIAPVAPQAAAPMPERARPIDLADPFFGVDAGGNTVPGAAVPFGFVEMSPDTVYMATNGYASRGNIIGFSPTHVSGTGGNSKYGNFRITPTTGELAVGNLNFAKSEETASPGFYGVTLASQRGPVVCELTASRLVGIQRYTFPVGVPGNLILDVTSHVLLNQKATRAEATVVDDRHVSGSASLTGGWNPAPYKMYFYAEFSRPAVRMGTWTFKPGAQQMSDSRHVEGEQASDYRNRAGVFAVFDTSRARSVEVKIGVLFISAEKARANIATEASGGFDDIRARAVAEWEKVFATIQVTGGTDAQRRVFYSSLLRLHYMPHDVTGENVWWQSQEPHYEDFYTLWDTFRTVHPLFTLIEPDRQRDMLRSLIDTYRHTGWLPDSRIAGANGMTQGGSNGDVLVADALVKAMSGIDYATAYEALKKDADVESPDQLNEGRQLEDYKRLGYMSLSYTRSASRTLEYGYDDFCIAEVAHILGHADDARRYLERSAAWTKLWDPNLKCVRPRYADGRWLENYDCDREWPDFTTEWWDAPFYEGSGIQYSTYVPHDPKGLIAKLGGDAGFVAWLDRIFDASPPDEPAVGASGQTIRLASTLYNPGNEPDILAPYLYIHAGRPDRTALRVRRLLASQYHPGRDGLPGNDDAGTMSSWYIWGAIGLYPNAGQPFYYIGSPIFPHTVMQVGGGRTVVIDAPETSDSHLYVQSAEWNGSPLLRAWLTHQQVAAGGRLVLHMGSSPSKWAIDDRPPNGMDVERR
jgi:predicted alpha-1,2-mannosidase